MFFIYALFALLCVSGSAYADDAPIQLGLDPGSQTELGTFYALRGNHRMWDFSDDAALKRTMGFIDSVDALIAYHGLDKVAYNTDALRKLAISPDDSDKKKLEMLITASLLHLAHDLHGDSVNLDTLYTGWNFHRTHADIPALLNDAITNGTLADFFAKIAPQNPAYRALAKALQAYTAIQNKGGWPSITPGSALKPQDRDARVTQLRARLVAEQYMPPAPDDAQASLFDEALGTALTTYQVRNGLSPDGHAGLKTLEALNVPVAARVAQIRANMERWRHIPEDFPPDHYALVNIPAFTVTIVDKGEIVYRGAAIDGQVERQTPFINSTITSSVINPSWHVPISIARKDILPKLQKNPHYLEKLGVVIDGRTNDPTGADIDWKSLTPEHFNYQLRQIPGDLNSLGQIKFNFDNPFSVYMHGTPHQELFDKAERDFSSGCVRLQEPERVGELLLAENKDSYKGERVGWSEQRIDDTIDAGKTVWIKLARPMPVFFLYWDVFADEDGIINFRKDIYGYDALLINKMKDMAN